jgi:uncharacterized repeat protein (TIGR03803 family)
VADSSGNLFGTTQGGGADNLGTVFEVAHNSNTITTLASFTGRVEQYANGGLVVDSSGNLFGTTQQGGAGGTGTVFEVAHNAHTITTLASFASTGSNEEYPQGGLVEDSSGNLFGTTSLGGAGGTGTVFEVAHNTHTITTLASFASTGSNGQEPQWGLVEDSRGNLFGITFEGGAGGYGTVFEVAHNSHTISDLGSFTVSNGEYPIASLVEDSSGNLYGITYGGGAGGGGTLFEVPHAATITWMTVVGKQLTELYHEFLPYYNARAVASFVPSNDLVALKVANGEVAIAVRAFVDTSSEIVKLGGQVTAVRYLPVAFGLQGVEVDAIFPIIRLPALGSLADVVIVRAQDRVGDPGSVAPSITVNPHDRTVLPGRKVTFTAAATGIPAPIVQWLVSSDGGKIFVNIPGANSTTFTFTPRITQDGDEFRAVFSNELGQVSSSAARLLIPAEVGTGWRKSYSD